MAAPTHTDTTNREIVTTRLFDVPRELVFKAWSSAQALDAWFGPEGFRNETLEMDFRAGGKWRFIMHGPDGTDYPNRMDFIEIVAPEHIAYIHSDDDDNPSTRFQGLVTFVENGGKTELTLRAILETAEERERVVAEHGAIEGAQQTLARLAAYLESAS
jgi:uncharacterized protein YndB with AHSA1/START domain